MVDPALEFMVYTPPHALFVIFYNNIKTFTKQLRKLVNTPIGKLQYSAYHY